MEKIFFFSTEIKTIYKGRENNITGNRFAWLSKIIVISMDSSHSLLPIHVRCSPQNHIQTPKFFAPIIGVAWKVPGELRNKIWITYIKFITILSSVGVCALDPSQEDKKILQVFATGQSRQFWFCPMLCSYKSDSLLYRAGVWGIRPHGQDCKMHSPLHLTI